MCFRGSVPISVFLSLAVSLKQQTCLACRVAATSVCSYLCVLYFNVHNLSSLRTCTPQLADLGGVGDLRGALDLDAAVPKDPAKAQAVKRRRADVRFVCVCVCKDSLTFTDGTHAVCIKNAEVHKCVCLYSFLYLK